MLSIDSRNIFFFSLCLMLSCCCCCCCVGHHPREKRERSKILEKDDEKTDPRGWNARRAFRIEITTRDENKSVARVESENLRRELSLPNRRVRCRARARAVEKIEKNDQGRSRRRKTKETFQTAFLKSAPLPHSRRCRNSPRSSLLRPARSRRNRRPRTRCRRPNRTRFLLLLLLLLSHSFFLFFFCALRSAVVVSLSQVRPFSSSFRSLFFGQFSGFRNQSRLLRGTF